MENIMSYPEVSVEKENSYYADLLSIDYAGDVSETTAVMLYSYQHFDKFKENEEFSKILEKIAIDEMIHLELLGKTIKLLGKNPVYKTCEARKEECIMWSSKNVDYTTNLKEMLEVDINSEKIAIKTYEAHKKIINDKYIKVLLDRIILDEKRHLEIFTRLYNKI